MKSFLKRAVLFACLLVFIFYGLDYAITKGLRKTQFVEFYDWNDIFNGRIDADLIINGSSRASVQISPRIIDSVLHVRSYNLGISGHHILMQVAKYRTYLSFNKPPKIIIFSVESFSFSKSENLYGYVQFMPYLHHPIIQEATQQFTGFKKVDYVLPLFRYRSVPGIAKVGLWEYLGLKRYTNASYRGYTPQERAWTREFEDFKSTHLAGYETTLDSASIQLFDEYLSACAQENIRVFLVYAPEYVEAQALLKNRKKIIALYQHFSKKYNFPFLDYSADSLSMDKAYFYNSTHLNKRGAEIFTRKLAGDIRDWGL